MAKERGDIPTPLRENAFVHIVIPKLPSDDTRIDRDASSSHVNRKIKERTRFNFDEENIFTESSQNKVNLRAKKVEKALKDNLPHSLSEKGRALATHTVDLDRDGNTKPGILNRIKEFLAK